MKIHIVSKRIELTNPIRSKIENTFAKLKKYINSETDIYVNLSVTKNSQKVEATIFTKNGTIIRAEDSQYDLYVAIDLAYDKLYKQIRKFKTQLNKKNKSNESIRFNNIDEYIDPITNDEFLIKRVKKFNFEKPVTVEDAIMQMNLLGHNFFVFRNFESEDINIVYKRHDGYGLIEQI